MQATIVPGVSLWSAWQPDRDLYFNSWFVEGPAGNFVVDPLPGDDALYAAIRAKGLAGVAITNRDHERAAAAFAQEFDAQLIVPARDAAEMSVTPDRTVDDGDDVFGWRVVRFDGMKSPGEFALFRASDRTAIAGDAFWGKPAGALTLMPDDKLADPLAAALSARKLLMLNPRHLLVGDGAPVFETAYATLAATLAARAGVFARRINVDELALARQVRGGSFKRNWSEIGFALGAERLGYALMQFEPGDSGPPYHWHSAEEELFVVWEGSGEMRVPQGTFALRKGDIVCCPVGLTGSHRFYNNGTEPLTLIAIANVEPADVGGYPDSRKVMLRASQTIVRDHPQLDYLDGEV